MGLCPSTPPREPRCGGVDSNGAKKSFQVAFYKEGAHWLSQALNVEVSTFGDPLDEAKAAINEALELYFEDGSAV